MKFTIRDCCELLLTAIFYHRQVSGRAYLTLCLVMFAMHLNYTIIGVTLHHDEKFAEFAESKYNQAQTWLKDVQVTRHQHNISITSTIQHYCYYHFQ
jgi:hypothetical protein